VSYIPQYVTVPIDRATTPFETISRIFKERAAGYSRDLMEGAEPPYSTEEEYIAVLRQMCGQSAVRVCNGVAHIINRKTTADDWHNTDGGWAKVPLNAVSEAIRLGYLKRFQQKRELDRVGWEERGWDGDQADWYGWPA
jgi:hypothetical protein